MAKLAMNPQQLEKMVCRLMKIVIINITHMVEADCWTNAFKDDMYTNDNHYLVWGEADKWI
jgi:hypothetical protein